MGLAGGLATNGTSGGGGGLPSTDDLVAITTANPTTGNWSNNSHKITGLANGTVSTDAAALGQITATQAGALPNTDDLSAIATANVTAANVPMNSKKFTGLVAGTAPTDSPTLGQVPRLWERNAAWSGVTDQVWDLAAATVVGQGPATQKVYGTLVALLAGDVVSNVALCVTQAGSGTPPTGFYVGLYSTAGAQLAVSANFNSSSKLTTAGVQSFALGTPYTVPATGVYYLTALQNVVFGGTALQVAHVATTSAAALTASSIPFCVAQTSQATMPSPATFAAANDNVWFGWS